MQPQKEIAFTEQAIIDRLGDGLQKALEEASKLPSEPFEPMPMNVAATTFVAFSVEVAKELARLHSALSASLGRHEEP